ncbi:DUF2958 domain-containing protein [Sphingomonas sp. HITSZ_GF]|uniref:DUF2958 domain-containing protein n=1 Tax=Sphingomonas sp. HITSZ_GF TaxID=3037247 RepID=UPI00240DA4A9|nr:DUF2958 domain-containing protein [Sphingomonas sp. HITSZ_GF]MDG2535269.1 DUF2958 domain-containing protein [Sphingomonas sp. HITSZ_GF]
MMLLTPELRAALRAQYRSDVGGKRPLVKLFNPLSAATWLASELAEDGNALFGLADLGFGCPELGWFSLSEIEALRLPFGLRIERDLHFSTNVSLSDWAGWARKAGSILWAEALLRRASDTACDLTDRFPPPE